MINPHIATQIREGREAEIETRLDPARATITASPTSCGNFPPAVRNRGCHR